MNQTLQIGPAIAFWLDGIRVQHAGVTKPASEHLQDIYDHVVLMDYRDRAHGPDGILSHAEDELAYGRRIGKPVWLGIETAPNEIRKLSFQHPRADGARAGPGAPGAGQRVGVCRDRDSPLWQLPPLAGPLWPISQPMTWRTGR